MLWLEHYKGSCGQPHEVSLGADHKPYDPFGIVGRGETEEAAIKDFKDKFDYVMHNWNAFSRLLNETDVIINNTVEVDCFGNVIKN